MFDQAYQSLGEALSTPPDYVKLFSLFLVAYPLSAPLVYLSPSTKHVVNIVTTTFFLYGILAIKSGYLQLLANIILTYNLTLHNVGGPSKMPWIVFALQMGHLTINHLVRAFGNIPLSTIEVTAMQMVLCMNLTSFAWSVHDGKNRSRDECDEQQRSMRIPDEEFPSLLEFLGYAFYFPGVLVGPSTRFVDYRAWSNGSIYKTVDKLPPAGRFRTAAIEILLGFVYMGIWMSISGRYDYGAFLISADVPGSALKYGFFGRLGTVVLTGFAARTKYYGIWALTNGACILSGLSYNGVSADGKSTRWDRCKNIDVAGVELANNWKELLDSWNMNTNVWLRNNVYKRVAKPGKKPGFKSTMATFVTSAFWHGIAPGYYSMYDLRRRTSRLTLAFLVTFVLGGLLQSVGRSMRAHLRPFAFTNPRFPNPSFKTWRQYSPIQLLYCALSIIGVKMSMDFTALPFILLEVGKSWAGWRALRFYGIFMAIVPMVAFRLGLGALLDERSGIAENKRRERKAKQDAAEQQKQHPNQRVSTGNGNPQVPDVDAVEDEAREYLDEAQKKTR